MRLLKCSLSTALDPELASVFKFKQIHEMTSKDIPEGLDEHQRERVSYVKAQVLKPLAIPLKHMFSHKFQIMCLCLFLLCCCAALIYSSTPLRCQYSRAEPRAVQCSSRSSSSVTPPCPTAKEVAQPAYSSATPVLACCSCPK